MIKKRGQILVENVVFIILNLIFLTILILFIYSKIGSEALLEEKYSKQIALLIDSAKPGMIIHLNMEDAIKEAEENNFNEKIVRVEGNVITVKLREKGENSYSFFNNVEVLIFAPTLSTPENEYVIKINDYN
tara:strand:+ start:939 stop:1334 length:396 start_codon:yes stop_codon:yes gene_type:complete